LAADGTPILPYSAPGERPRARRAISSPPLAQHATRGFAWLMLQTFGQKLVSFGSEVVLALWLVKSDFGLRSDAMTVLAFAALLQDYGINQVLIHRQQRFALWANAAFWASLAIGLLGALALAAAAPLVARLYHAPELTGMILLLALRSPINAIGTVSYARLQVDLRYKTLAQIGFATVCVTAFSAIACARLHMGAYSFMWPLVLAAAVLSILLWQAAPPPIKRRLQTPRWRYLTGQSGLLILASALFTLTGQGDYMTLGAIYRTEQGRALVVAIYFFGFYLCVQTTQFITSNLANVLLPTFSKLQHEPARLKAAFLRATRMLAILGVFVCLLQAAVAAPMIQTLFRPKLEPDKWVPAVPILQVISLALALQLFNMPAQSLIQAQGRFGTLLKLAVLCPVVFFVLVLAAAATGQTPDGQIRFEWLGRMLETIFRQPVNVSVVVAIAVAVYCLIIGPAFLYAAIRPMGGTWREIWPIYVWPIVTSAAAIGIGMVACHWLPHTRAGNWAKLLLVPLISLVAYAPLVRLWAPDSWNELTARVGSMLRRGKG
jgi:O-antigen/teichoic acid export membrane protein